ncbi:MAG: DUF3408 domain-containing protein [Prevotellaceae bacterium]|nr:DUF3408 domain-containing protein [Prevotellaceae bacterium]
MAKSNKELTDINEEAFLTSLTGYTHEKKQIVESTPAENITADKPSSATVPDAITVQTDNSKQTGNKQRKLALEEFRQQFMHAPKIDSRKPVFVGETTRDELEWIVRLFGFRKLSVSGLIENLVLHFLETYKEDVEQWRKM